MKPLVNWRTSVFGSLTLASAFITQHPELISPLLSADVAKWVFSVAALITGFVAFSNAKDRQISGNGTLDDPNRKAGSGGRSEILP